MVSLVGAVVVLVAPALLAGAPAGADQIGSTQGQIAVVEGQITAAAGRVHQLTSAFDQANLTAANGAQQLAADEGNLAAARSRLAGSQQALRQDALQSYTGGTGGSVDQTASVAVDPGVSSAYIDVAVGSLSDSVDQFHLQQQQLQSAVTAVAEQQQANQRAVTATAAARSAALREAGSAQGHLATLETQLTSLVAQQAAAAAAAKASPPSAAQGGPVDNGLVAVVGTIVRSPAPTSTPTIVASTPPTAAPASAPTTAAPQPAPTPPTSGDGGAGGTWLQLRECESGDNYQANTGNGFYGAYQFSASTWTGLGYPGRPDQEPPAMQDQAAMRLQAQSGWGQWPACAAALGLS